MTVESNFDALLPHQMALKAEGIGIKKASMPFQNTLALAILAGAFIALGSIFFTTVTAGSMPITGADGSTAFSTALPYGITRLVGGLAFNLGLALVVIGGAELFTGNNLIVMAYASGKISLPALLRNWGVVYLGNFIGSILTALLMFVSKHYTYGKGTIGLNILTIGEAKTSLGFFQAIALGILCNALVCLAVWLCYSARNTTDKIMAILLPITAFVAAGFEHSVANMYFIPEALFVKSWAGSAFFDLIHKTPLDFPHITWSNFLVANLLPVTIGNIIGGAVMVGLVYWFVYLREIKVN